MNAQNLNHNTGMHQNRGDQTESNFSASKQNPSFLKDAFKNYGVLHIEKNLAKSLRF